MAHLKNLFNGTWSFGSYNNSGVWIPAQDQTNPSNNVGCTEFIQIDASKPATFSWSGWSTLLPADVTIHSYHTDSDATSYAKITIDHLGQEVVNNSITFENADGADYIRLYFHGAGSARQYIPVGFQITQAGVFDDVAFKVIVKNDGISDIIMKTIMVKGEAGGTIASIEKTSSVGVVDTYTITLNDGTTTTFEVTNGSNIASIEKTATAGLIDTYTVTLTNGDTSTFEVKNGEDAQLYELPQDCVVGYDKEPTQVTQTSYERYTQIDDVNGISSVKYNGNTLQETNDGRNLFDKDDSTLQLQGFLTDSIFRTASANIITICLPVDPSTTYTVSKVLSARFAIASCPSIPVNNSPVNNYVANNTGTVLTLTTSSSDHYLLAYVYSSQYDTLTLDDILETVQIEKGSTATYYQPYCGGVPSPNPDYPQEIIGVGTKQQDNTYSIDLVAEDADGNVYTVTASGLTHPVYAGDWIDLVTGVLHRHMGFLTKAIADMSGSEDYPGWTLSGIRALIGSGYNANLTKPTVYCSIGDNFSVNTRGTSNDTLFLPKTTYGLTQSQWLAQYPNLTVTFVFPLATPTDESITLTGDLNQVKRIRGEYAFIDAPQYASPTEITFGQETDFPDGYEEIDFPLDELLYYQDQEYIEFPTSWGFVMGYVFDADEIRFTMNVTKDLHEGFNVIANKSVDLALNLYTGSGGSNLTGFDSVDASFIREYGQIQIRLVTETPHGLALGSLLGARVSQGRLRITFEEASS